MVRVGEVRDPDPATHAIYDAAVPRRLPADVSAPAAALPRDPADHRVPAGLTAAWPDRPCGNAGMPMAFACGHEYSCAHGGRSDRRFQSNACEGSVRVAQIQDIWGKFNARERLTAWGALAIAIGSDHRADRVLPDRRRRAFTHRRHRGAGHPVPQVRTEPDRSTWPAPVATIILVISAIVAIGALLTLLDMLRLLGLVGYGFFAGAILAGVVTAVGGRPDALGCLAGIPADRGRTSTEHGRAATGPQRRPPSRRRHPTWTTRPERRSGPGLPPVQGGAWRNRAAGIGHRG